MSRSKGESGEGENTIKIDSHFKSNKCNIKVATHRLALNRFWTTMPRCRSCMIRPIGDHACHFFFWGGGGIQILYNTYLCQEAQISVVDSSRGSQEGGHGSNHYIFPSKWTYLGQVL